MGITKLSNIVFFTLAAFHNQVNASVFYCFRAIVQQAIHFQLASVVFVLVIFMKSSCCVYKGFVDLQFRPLQQAIGRATAAEVKESLL